MKRDGLHALAAGLLLLPVCPTAGFAQDAVNSEAEEAAQSIPAAPETEDCPDQVCFAAAAFVDAYYAWDSTVDTGNERAPFLYNHARHNEFNINLAMLRLSATSPHVRSQVALMAGTYPQQNQIAEQELLRHVMEANVGVGAGRVWLDMGLLPSHIGSESAISVQNLSLTRSLNAENSPYYLAGARLSWQVSDRVQAQFLLVNGWQNIRETESNGSKGVGTLVTVGLADGWTLGSAGWVSHEGDRDEPGLRLFHDLWLNIQRENTSSTLTFDVGSEDGDTGWSTPWIGAAVIVRQSIADPLALSVRLEHYRDPDGVIVSGLQRSDGVFGGSLGADLTVRTGTMLRTEWRMLSGEEGTFANGEATSHIVTLSLASLLEVPLR